MSNRFAWFILLPLTATILSQQQAVPQNQQWVRERSKTITIEQPPELDPEAIRLRTIHRDAEELSALSVSLQSDLQQLQKGMLPKDLARDLKKVEKLSKRLREEVAP